MEYNPKLSCILLYFYSLQKFLQNQFANILNSLLKVLIIFRSTEIFFNIFSFQ